MKRSRWLIYALSAALLVLVAACGNVAEAPNQSVAPAEQHPALFEWDLLTGPVENINGGLWFPGVTFKVGTGVIDPFLTIQNGPYEEGFNTDTANKDFEYDQTRTQFTDELPLNLVTQIRLGDVQILQNGVDPIPGLIADGYTEDDRFRELILDANEANSAPDAQFALNEFDLWVCEDPYNGKDPATYTQREDFSFVPGATGFPSTNDCTLEYSFRVSPQDITSPTQRAAATDSATQGSGSSLDYYVLIPDSVFDEFPGCDYKPDSDCGVYVVLWSTMGVTQDEQDAATPTPEFDIGDWVTGSTFEEYSTLVRPWFELDVSKTASGSYDVTPELQIDKSVDPLTQAAFIGDTVSFDWTIAVSETGSFVESNFAVTGEISVYNPSPARVRFLVSDVLDDGTPASNIDCDPGTEGNQNPVTVEPEDTTVCTYDVAPSDRSATSNDATVTVVSVDWGENEVGTVAGGTASADIGEWQANPVPASATLQDSGAPSDGQSVGAGFSETYEETYSCSTTLADYSENADLDNQVVNTAKLFDGAVELDTASATTEIDCYLPSIEKTAAGTYDERHEWTVTKTVDPESQSAFIGDTVTFEWTIDVSETIFEENFDVAGTITVGNPNPEDVLVVALSDVLNGTTATIDQASCAFDGTNVTVAAGGSETCDYEANDLGYSDLASAPTLNTATITLNGIDFDGTATIGYTANVIRGTATLDDDQFPYDGESVDDGWSSTYEDSYTCSTTLDDYSGNADLDNEVENTAEVYSDGALQDSSTATTEIDCYLWDVTKTADGSYDDRYEWTIDKTVDPTSQSGFAGETLDWTWTVTWNSSFVGEENHAVTGLITVDNPNPEDALTVAITDELTGGFGATVTCNDGDGGTSLTIAAGGSGTCDYTAAPSSQLAQNTATASRNGVSVSDTIDVTWLKGEDIGLDASISDTTYGSIPVDSPQPFEYTRDVTCSSDSIDYGADGTYSGSADNTATITWTGGSDSDDATTTYDCYAPLVSKDATPTYTREFDWTITKEYDGTYDLEVGQSVVHDYLVSVDQTVSEYDFAVSGTITVANPNPDASMTVSLADELSGGIAATLDCGGSLTIPAGGSDTCGYAASLSAKIDGTNTATATINGARFDGTADYTFGDPTTIVGYSSINVSDTNGESWSASGDDSWSYTRDFLCDGTGDFVNGVYTYEHPNTATIVDTGDSDSATVTVNCYADWNDETAWAANGYTPLELPYNEDGTGDWATYVTYDGEAKTVGLFANQTVLVGDVTLTPVIGGVLITIDLIDSDGLRFYDIPTNVLIQDYVDPPSGNPAPGQFGHRGYADEDPFTITVPANNYYGIHVNVELLEGAF